VFTVIVGTCLVYGLGAAPLARTLGVAEPEPRGILLVGSQQWLLALADALSEMGPPVAVLATGHYRLVDRHRTWRLLTVPATDPAVPEVLGSVRSAVVVSLDDEHNALALARCLEVLARREVYLLPADAERTRATHAGEPAGAAMPFEPLDELEGGGEAAPARAWERRPFAPGLSQRQVEAAYASGGMRLLAGPGPLADDDLVLAICGEGGHVDLAPRGKTLQAGETAIVVGPSPPPAAPDGD
jgi:hypothetical protein